MGHQTDTCVQWELEEKRKHTHPQSDNIIQSHTANISVIQAVTEITLEKHEEVYKQNIEEIERSTTLKEEIFEILEDHNEDDDVILNKNKPDDLQPGEGIEKRESVSLQEYDSEFEYSCAKSADQLSLITLAVFLVIVSLIK